MSLVCDLHKLITLRSLYLAGIKLSNILASKKFESKVSHIWKRKVKISCKECISKVWLVTVALGLEI